VEELEGENNFCGVESGARFVELAGALNLEHQVATVHVLHHEEQTILGLKKQKKKKY
jgi:hypothetical protein